MDNYDQFERYLRADNFLENPIKLGEKIEGKCTPEGTRRFVERGFTEKDIPKRNFRKPILEEGSEFM